jgi:signal transduction histidine kinase
MPNGGKLSLQATRKDNNLLIGVKDTGVGIPKELKNKIFTPLFTTKSKGQGLGLAVVKRLVNVLKGNITYVSEEGRGTEFTVELPIT